MSKKMKKISKNSNQRSPKETINLRFVREFDESKMRSAEDLLNEFENDLKSGKLGTTDEEIMESIKKRSQE